MVEDHFSFARYILLRSAAAILVAACLLCGIFYKISIHQLVQTHERANIALTRSFANALWGLIDDAVERSHGLNGDQLRARSVTRTLRTALDEQLSGLSVLKVKIYNSGGLTVFSTEPNQMGVSKSDSLGFQSAANGQVISELSFRDSIYSLEGTISDRDVVASYIPIEDRRGRVRAVFEVYDDVTEPLASLRYIQWVVFGLVGLICTILFGAILTIVERAHSRFSQAQSIGDLPAEMTTAEV